ncbi:MAG: peptide ABC transporter permease [Legionellales bacterium]|nr:peptide ABC transporter permease [Legionellales bacterium]|tara:strand:- start:211 stop:1542 length:1332 start_codon:yes stop_codon:yes gene_type:complete
MQDYKYTLFWSDIPIYFIAFALIYFIGRLVVHKQGRKSASVFMNQPINMISSVVLAFFFIVSFLDSIHLLNSSASVLSVLDYLLKPFILSDEKTYSSPLSIYAFSKEVIYDGHYYAQTYPRLSYGGAHIKDLSQWSGDILRLLVSGLWHSLIAVLCLFVIFFRIFKLHRQTVAWKSGFITVSILVIATIFSLELSAKYHLLGTNKVGGDVFFEAIKGIRTAIVFGVLTCFSILPFATVLGIAAGYFKGAVDDLIQYIYTTLSAIPGILLIAAMVLIFDVSILSHSQWFGSSEARADARLILLCLIIGSTSWTGLCRLLRGEVLKLSNLEFIQAARCLGASNTRILFKHLLPNVRHIIIISLALDFSGFVLAEAVLSYIGVGVDPSTYSWGSMINSARIELSRSPVVWWSLFASFFFMFSLVACVNVFADGLRDHLDPRVSKEG